MKNKPFLLVMLVCILALSFGFVACGGDDDGGVPDTAGRLTITGLSAYNGKYTYAQGYLSNNAALTAVASLNSNGLGGKAGHISNGTVTLKVWSMTLGGTEQNPSVSNIKSYAGNDTLEFYCFIFDSENVNNNTNPIAMGYLNPTTGEITFSNGIASGQFVYMDN